MKIVRNVMKFKSVNPFKSAFNTVTSFTVYDSLNANLCDCRLAEIEKISLIF